MMRQFYKAKIFIEKEADAKMVQEEVAPFEHEVDNFVNDVTIGNEDEEDLKITLGFPMEIKKVLQHPTKWHNNSLKGNIKIQMVCKTQFYSILPQSMEICLSFACE